MKKKPYRTVAVNDVKPNELRGMFGGKKLCVGIDAAKTKFVAAFTGYDGAAPLFLRWDHPSETRAFLALLSSSGAAEVEAAIEPTGPYSAAIVEQLRLVGVSVFRVSTKHTHDARELFDGVPSQHDPKAASIIARLHRDALSSPWLPTSDARRALSAMVKTLSRKTREQQARLNELESWLAMYWPEVTRLFELDSVTLHGLLATFGGPARVAANASEAEALMVKVSRGLAREKIGYVIASATSTTGVRMTAAESRALTDLARDLQRGAEEERAARAAVREEGAACKSVVNMAAVVGEATAAVLVAEVGDPSDFPNAGSYVKAMGLNLRENSSGQKQGGVSITKRGSPRARQWLFLAVLRLVQSNAVIRAWHQAKVEREGGQRGKKSVVAIMRKLAKALWHVARGSAFEPAKLYDVRRFEQLSAIAH